MTLAVASYKGIARTDLFLLRQLTQSRWACPLSDKNHAHLCINVLADDHGALYGHLSWRNTTYGWIIVSFSTTQPMYPGTVQLLLIVYWHARHLFMSGFYTRQLPQLPLW